MSDTCPHDHEYTERNIGRTPRGYRYCKDCKAAGTRAWRVKRRTEDLAGFRARDNERAKTYGRGLRLQILNVYGNKCACCGETEEKFLALDHVNNDGAQHRKRLSNSNAGSSVKVYADVKRQGFPSTFQLLCHNCNFAKSRGGCPHVA